MICAAALLLAAPAEAQPHWTEADVVRLTLARSPDVAAADADRARAEAAVVGAALPDNPRLSFEREQILADPSRAHDVLALRVPLTVSGRRGARRALARFDAASLGLHAIEQRRLSVAEALDVFWQIIATDVRIAIAERAEAALSEASRVMTRREGEGAASGYESARLAIADELARSRLAEARADGALLRTRLVVVVDPRRGRPPELAGRLGTSRRRSIVLRGGAASSAAPAWRAAPPAMPRRRPGPRGSRGSP
jgi:hypothetical protein